jgi:hypothetical protein
MRRMKQKEVAQSYYDLFSSTNINVGEINSRRVGWAGHVTRTGVLLSP